MKVKELIAKLQEFDQEAEVQVETWAGCHGPEDLFQNPEVTYGYDDVSVFITAEKGCMCVKRTDRLSLPEAIKENSKMKEAFFKLRKDAFLSRLDRWEVMEMAVKFVGNKPND